MNNEFAYKYVTDKDRALIVETQLKQLEGEHFSISIIEPSQLKEQQDHMVWKQRIIGIERMIKKLRQVQNELGLNNLTVVPEEE
tara:strand:- start:153 stop:404 length:252 start_codon:yes stop_codon:yes gene_type:complete